MVRTRLLVIRLAGRAGWLRWHEPGSKLLPVYGKLRESRGLIEDINSLSREVLGRSSTESPKSAAPLIPTPSDSGIEQNWWTEELIGIKNLFRESVGQEGSLFASVPQTQLNHQRKQRHRIINKSNMIVYLIITHNQSRWGDSAFSIQVRFSAPLLEKCRSEKDVVLAPSLPTFT